METKDLVTFFLENGVTVDDIEKAGVILSFMNMKYCLVKVDSYCR